MRPRLARSAPTPATRRCRAAPAFRSSSRRCIRATKPSRATRVLAELTPRLLDLARLAKEHDLQFTVDAEEADRLELSLEVIGAVLDDPSLGGWDGFGLAVQAYQKRALAVIDWIEDVAAAKNRRLTVRLVKGAYWDTEIKRAQERGLADYPVFTRKAMTDLCYMACVKKLLGARARLFPQFATHNALTVASVIEDAGGVAGYEFQRLYGMGEALYDALLAEFPDAACRIYAPVGNNRDLLAYLVRRLLENGANSSFVSVAADPNVPIADILARPQSFIANAQQARNRKIPLPRDLYQPERQRLSRHRIRRSCQPRRAAARGAAPRRSCRPRRRRPRRLSTASRCPASSGSCASPIDGREIGIVSRGRRRDRARRDGRRRGRLCGLGGDAGRASAPRRSNAPPTGSKSIAAGSLRCCRARPARRSTTRSPSCARRSIIAAIMPRRRAPRWRRSRCRGRPARATNCAIAAAACLFASARGIFRWPFSSARSAPRSLPAMRSSPSPPSRRRSSAALAVALLHEAGVPQSALHLVPGDGAVGASLVADPRTAGVRLYRLDRSRPRDQSRAGGERPDRSCRSSPRPAASMP